MLDLLRAGELPDGWRCPGAFRRLVVRGLLHLESWHVLEGDRLRWRLTGLRQRYPGRRLLPFADRQDRPSVLLLHVSWLHPYRTRSAPSNSPSASTRWCAGRSPTPAGRR